MDGAAAQALKYIDELLVGQEDDLSVPYSALNDAISKTVKSNSNVIVKMVDKVLRQADKSIVATGDALDAVQTRVLLGLDEWLHDQEYLLQNLSVKGGLTEPGQPLQSQLVQETTTAPSLAYQGTLVLEMRELAPILTRIAVAVESLAGIGGAPGKGSMGFAADLIEVLREIRDRQPSPPIRTKDEFGAIAAAEVVEDPNIMDYHK